MHGLHTQASRFPMAETLDRLTAGIAGAGWHLFARVDHAAEAHKRGLDLRPTVLLLFGNPAVGTRLMQDRQMAAIDLPMKILAWEDADGRVQVTWNDTAWLQQRHDLQDAATLRVIADVVQRVAAGGIGAP